MIAQDVYTTNFGPWLSFISAGKNIRVDWNALISDLERSGYTLQGISDQIGKASGTLKGWKAGSRPKFEDALPLIFLWSAVTEKSADQLPVFHVEVEI